MTEKSIFVYKLFCHQIFENLIFYAKTGNSQKKITLSVSATSSNNGAPVKPPFFENLVGGSVRTNNLALYQEWICSKKIGQYEEI